MCCIICLLSTSEKELIFVSIHVLVNESIYISYFALTMTLGCNSCFQNLGEVPRSVEIIIGSARDLLEKCQEIQVSLTFDLFFTIFCNFVHGL